MKKAPVQCPKCGHTQQEPVGGYSTVCKNCKQHYRLEDALSPAAKPVAAARASRQVNCFSCGTLLDVSAAAQSTMCKKCSSHVDLQDYAITNAVSRNYRTKGRFVIDQGGFLFNTDSIAGDVAIKGRLLGKLKAEGNLEIYSSAEIKGSVQGGNLVIPATEHFRWKEVLSVTGADISGELVASLRATGKVILRGSARLFGDVHSKDFLVEPGAVFVGRATVGKK